jgi:hypothetical protein
VFDTLTQFPDARCHGTGIHLPWADQIADPIPLTNALTIWRSHHGVGGETRSYMKDDRPFEPAFLARLNVMLAPVQGHALAFIFVTVGHQPNYLSPVLPHLLSALPRFETVFALRNQTATFPASALKLVECLLKKGKTCLLLQDLSIRLLPEDAAADGAGEIRFSLITPNASKGAVQ